MPSDVSAKAGHAQTHHALFPASSDVLVSALRMNCLAKRLETTIIILLCVTIFCSCKDSSSEAGVPLFLVDLVRNAPGTFEPARLLSLREQGNLASSVTLEHDDGYKGYKQPFARNS